MGRGLSDLQRAILVVALRFRPRRLESEHWVVDAFTFELLEEGFGWKSLPDSKFGGRHFDKGKIGVEAYEAAHAALSRAIRRLEERGLVKRIGRDSRPASVRGLAISGVILTPKGVKEAESLSK